MFSRFFIDRPIFATVLALIMVLAGTISVIVLPVELYPEIAPPVVEVATSYPGADAQTIVDTVTAPLEQQINGVEGMIYMKSTSTDAGTVSVNVTFELGTDPDLASVFTQNRVAIAEPQLPEEVRRQGITTKKKSPSILMVISLLSPDGVYDDLFLSNYSTIYIKDALARVPGVGEVKILGAKDFSMRIWIDPEKLASRDLTTVDVLDALRSQNVQVSAGQIGQPPASTESGFQYTVNTLGRLESVEQFEEIIIEVGEDQRVVRVKDVARVELSAQDFSWRAQVNGQSACAMSIYQLPGSNAVELADQIIATMESLAPSFPPGLEYEVTFDFTEFVRASIKSVVENLLIAAALVFLVTYIFLQDWRATLVPTVAIPVSLIATFGVLLASGYSLNMLTLFGLILAIGIVVDDAIVVVENTARKIDEEGLEPRPAARAAMDEISGALVATTLVVLAVFIPASLLPGITGVLYRQFAITIAVATCISTLNALTLSPALCGILLRPSRETRFPLFKLFNSTLDTTRIGYLFLVKKGIRLSLIVMLIFGGFCALTVYGLRVTPTGFIPDDDQGYFFINIQLPDAAKLARTESLLEDVQEIVLETDGVARIFTCSGYSILSGAQSSNAAMAIVVLDPWDQRASDRQIMAQLSSKFSELPQGLVMSFAPPPINGIGTAGGFEFELQDRGDRGVLALQEYADTLVAEGNADPDVTRLFSAFRASVPQLFVDIDRVKAQKIGVPLSIIFDTMATNLGSSYVNDFNLFGRVYRVYAQAEADYRAEVGDISSLQVRNIEGSTLPIDTVANVEERVGPSAINRYNLFPSASITGAPSPGMSSGQAIQAMDRLFTEHVPSDFAYEWTGMTYQQLKAGSQAPIAFALGFLVVFLVLAAQYESWTTPVSILLTVPLGVFGALCGIQLMGMDNNVYVQVGLVLLIALVAKNAILIVEFARELRHNGSSVKDAAVNAARLRFRPILMTAFSFVFGTFPLLIAVGAGAASRRFIGTTVFFGMVVATIIGVVFVPIFFVIIQSLAERTMGKGKDQGASEPDPPSPDPGDSDEAPDGSPAPAAG